MPATTAALISTPTLLTTEPVLLARIPLDTPFHHQTPHTKPGPSARNIKA